MLRCSLVALVVRWPVLLRSYASCAARVQVVALLATALALSAPVAAAADRPVRIVALGDSLTAGFGLPADAAFPAKLERALKAKGLADSETNKPVEGLLYFAIEGKNKPKDLSLLYKGAAGRLVIDFK